MDANPSPGPADRYCDLVMKGGIASGIVYPLAVADLARHYRFRSIGGTSAGAVAAVVTAAAEYRRRKTGSMAGFDVLRAVPGDLSKEVADDESLLRRLFRTVAGRHERRLKYLFQPQPGGCTRLFHVLLRALNRSSAAGNAMGVVLGLLEAYWLVTLAGVVAGAGTFAWYVGAAGALRAAIAGGLAAAAVIVAGIAAWVLRDATHDVVDNGFGLCRGTGHDKGHDAITPWLHHLIQDAAGRTDDGEPLTFGDLWQVDTAFPPAALGPMPADRRAIDLTIFTTNLAHGRPYLFPERDPRSRLFFKPDELAGLLPATVAAALRRRAATYVPIAAFGDPPASLLAEQGLLQLPDAADMPILLPARMSHSFPLLFSAVPLWAIDYEQPPGQRRWKRCWFSDGGLASNFPMHLFDGFLPAWPTFGVDLQEIPRDGSTKVQLPAEYLDGSADRWDRFDDRKTRASRLRGFLIGVFSTAQNWNDNTNARMPGVRDRVARVPLRPTEGGFNLNMSAKVQEQVAKRGAEAAARLAERYCPAPSAAPGAGWDQQRWVRLDVLLRSLKKRMPGVALALRAELPGTTSYDDLLARAARERMPGHDAPLTPQEVAALRNLLGLMLATANTIIRETEDYSPQPIPDPEIRVRPPL